MMVWTLDLEVLGNFPNEFGLKTLNEEALLFYFSDSVLASEIGCYN